MELGFSLMLSQIRQIPSPNAVQRLVLSNILPVPFKFYACTLQPFLRALIADDFNRDIPYPCMIFCSTSLCGTSHLLVYDMISLCVECRKYEVQIPACPMTQLRDRWPTLIIPKQTSRNTMLPAAPLVPANPIPPRSKKRCLIEAHQ